MGTRDKVRFYTADTHFGHKLVLTKMLRGGFVTIEDHDRMIADNINAVVGAKDELYILGDFAWARHEYSRQRIQCRQVFALLGNHDTRGKLEKIFGSCPDTMTRRDFGGTKLPVFMSHYPHAFWPSSHHGAFHLYGHMHNQEEVFLDRALVGSWATHVERRSMDVGVDSAKALLGEYRPFSEDEIMRILGNREGHHKVKHRDPQ